MYFSLFHLCIRKHLKEIGFLTLSLQPKEKGTRHLLALRWEKQRNGQKVFGIHCLWNWNKFWIK